MILIKSRKRVADHGEVFTPAWMVGAMLDLVKDESNDLYRAASCVLSRNLVHGDALTMRTTEGEPITFAEWGYLGKGKFQRRDFRFDVLTGSSAFSAEGSLFAHLGKHEIFMPTKTWPPMTVSDLAAAAPGDAPMEVSA